MADIYYMEESAEKPQLTVLVTSDQKEGVRETLETYRPHLDALGMTYEVLVIVNAVYPGQVETLRSMSRGWSELTVIGHRPWGGEDAALATGLRRGTGELVLILPGWPQVEPADLPALFAELEGNDMVSATRAGRPTGGWQGLRRGLFAKLLGRLFGEAPSDPFCRARLVKRSVLEDTATFGVRQHFLPVIAAQRGHNLGEATMRPMTGEAAKDAPYVFKPLGHVRALFDALALFVVLKFLRRPLRFFGAIGLPIFLVGAVLTLGLIAGRLFGDTALADRPALIFSVMMVVLGVQILAIGLVGEIIVFSGARKLKQYDVAEIITGPQSPASEAGEAETERDAPSDRSRTGRLQSTTV